MPFLCGAAHDQLGDRAVGKPYGTVQGLPRWRDRSTVSRLGTSKPMRHVQRRSACPDHQRGRRTAATAKATPTAVQPAAAGAGVPPRQPTVDYGLSGSQTVATQVPPLQSASLVHRAPCNIGGLDMSHSPPSLISCGSAASQMPLQKFCT